jgi:hypothetical protein
MKVYDYNIVKFDFFDTAVADILRAIDGSSLMGSFILSFCCIDYMGLAMNPTKEKNSSDDFKLFVRDWMSSANESYRVLDEHLWAVRNSLIHTYGESKATKDMNLSFSFSHEHPENHLRLIEDPKPTLWFNLPDFVAELVSSIEQFFREKACDESLLQTWYSKLIIVQGAASYLERLDILHRQKPEHKRSSRYLAILDIEPPPTIGEIKDHIAAELKSKLGNGS